MSRSLSSSDAKAVEEHALQSKSKSKVKSSSSSSSSSDHVVVEKGAKPINWSKYKINSKFAWIATLAAAIGQSFLFGLNIGLLNSSVNIISMDLWPCEFADISIPDECSALFDADPSFDIAVSCNAAVDDRDDCKYTDSDGDEQECTAPDPISCDGVGWQNSFLNCAVFLGAAIAALSTGGLLKFGRRKMNFLICIVYVVGLVSSSVAGTYPAFVWARLIVGMAVGMGSVLAPTYIAEMTPTNKKGMFGVFHQLFITIGILVSVILGLPFDYVEFDSITRGADGTINYVSQVTDFNQAWWRFMMACGIIPLVVNVVLFMYVRVDTPKYYLEADRRHDAHECLKRVYGQEDVDTEYSNLVKAVEEAEATKKSGMTLGRAFKNPQYRKVIIIGVTTSAFQQFSGINVLMAASNQLYTQAGVSYSLVTTLSVVLTAINMLCTFPAPYLIEKLGRKTLLLIGAVFQTLGFAVPMVMLWIDQDADYTKWTAIAGSYVFDVAFAVSTGPVLWVWMTEIFPYSIAAVATGLLVGANWVAGIIMVFVGTALTDNRYSFTIFTILNILGVLLVLFAVKETKGYKAGHSPYITE